MIENIENKIEDDLRDELVETITNEISDDNTTKPKYDPQSRNWTFEISYEDEFGYSDDIVIPRLQSLGLEWFCLSNLEMTIKNSKKHKHGAISRGNQGSPLRRSTLMRLFPKVHWEKSKGSMLENRIYCMKLEAEVGKEKANTVIDNSFYEEGTIPTETGKLILEEQVLNYIENYMEENELPPSTKQVIKEFPKTAFKKQRVDDLINMYLVEKFSDEHRDDLIVTFITSTTNVGKTTFVYNLFKSAKQVFRVHNYKQKHALWDKYDPLNNICVVFDEFVGNGQMEITDFNIYSDKFPIINLPARFNNICATYKFLFILSNLDVSKIFSYEREFDPELWNAFYRRLHNIWRFYREPDSNILKIEKIKHTRDIDLMKDMKNIEFIEKGVIKNENKKK